MTPAQNAYKIWKESHKIDMQVRTDEQMFIVGYESRDVEVQDLTELVVDLLARVNELKNKKAKKTNADS